MKYILQLGILIAFWIVGDGISYLLSSIIVIPGAIIGMILLFIALTSGLIKESLIKDTSDFFLNNIAFFFLPASVAIMDVSDSLKGAVIPLLIIGLLSTLITMIVTMITTQLLVTARHKK